MWIIDRIGSAHQFGNQPGSCVTRAGDCGPIGEVSASLPHREVAGESGCGAKPEPLAFRPEGEAANGHGPIVALDRADLRDGFISRIVEWPVETLRARNERTLIAGSAVYTDVVDGAAAACCNPPPWSNVASTSSFSAQATLHAASGPSHF